jgi:peptide/nickel transport system permease protein
MLIGVTLITFSLTQLVPGDPARLLAGRNATLEQVETIRQRLGLDRPLPEQYLRYMRNLLQGDLGRSVLNGRPVLDNLQQFFPATLELTLAAFSIATLIGIPLGVISAVYKDSLIDHISRVGALIGIAFPLFWVGIVLILIFFFYLDWLPGGYRVDLQLINQRQVPPVTRLLLLDSLLAGDLIVFGNALTHLILPAVTLSLGSMARFTRFTRAVMLEVLDQEYVRVARAKGLLERVVVLRHGLRNALIPTVTVMGLAIGFMLGGSVLVETIFNWPGIGQYAYDSIINLDYPSILGVTLLATIIFLLSNLAVDIIYVVLDPRIEYT